MTNLSPAAQAIVKAFDDRWACRWGEDSWQVDDWQEQCIAAALRVVADHVQHRANLLAIADELEGQPNE
jgi:hypothetical protein